MAGGTGNQRARNTGPPLSGPPQAQPPPQQQRPQQQGGNVHGKFDGPGDVRQNPFGPSMGFDPARSGGPSKPSIITNRRVELPPDAYRLENGPSKVRLAQASPIIVLSRHFAALNLHPLCFCELPEA
ncbi:hypothetical protein B0J14DRAFT_555812 [Halenospora varia]|nr:hypothetical protein B0J14DRAFT_555812 [Halenospora varia]